MDQYKVLIVDDEPFIRKGIKKLIHWDQFGFEICAEAEDGQEALSKIDVYHPHLVITDIRMPGMDGLDFIRICREKYGNTIHFIILSGFSEFSYARIAMRYHVNYYLLKPIDEEELQNALSGIHKDIQEINQEKNTHMRIQEDLIGQYLKKIADGEFLNIKPSEIMEKLHIVEQDKLQVLLFAIVPHGNDSPLTELTSPELASLIRQVFIQIIGESRLVHVFQDQTNRYGLLVNQYLIDRCLMSVDQLSDQTRKRLELQTGHHIFVASGSVEASFDQIRKSYLQAAKILEQRQFYANHHIDQRYDHSQSNYTYHIQESKSIIDLINAIASGDVETAGHQVSVLCHEIYRLKLAPETIRILLDYIAYEILKIIQTFNADSKVLVIELSSVTESIQVMNFQLFRQRLLIFCENAAKYVKQNKEISSASLVSQVEDYVIRNYSSNLTLKTIAERFHINPVYLGQIFRKELGVYFNDYLHKLRIEKAKQLLLNSELRISEIAIRIGYRDDNYFSNKFQKQEKMTPHQYRKTYS